MTRVVSEGMGYWPFPRAWLMQEYEVDCLLYFLLTRRSQTETKGDHMSHSLTSEGPPE